MFQRLNKYQIWIHCYFFVTPIYLVFSHCQVSNSKKGWVFPVLRIFDRGANITLCHWRGEILFYFICRHAGTSYWFAIYKVLSVRAPHGASLIIWNCTSVNFLGKHNYVSSSVSGGKLRNYVCVYIRFLNVQHIQTCIYWDVVQIVTDSIWKNLIYRGYSMVWRWIWNIFHK